MIIRGERLPASAAIIGVSGPGIAGTIVIGRRARHRGSLRLRITSRRRCGHHSKNCCRPGSRSASSRRSPRRIFPLASRGPAVTHRLRRRSLWKPLRADRACGGVDHWRHRDGALLDLARGPLARAEDDRRPADPRGPHEPPERVHQALRRRLAGRGDALVSETLGSNTINQLGGILVPALVVGLGQPHGADRLRPGVAAPG